MIIIFVCIGTGFILVLYSQFLNNKHEKLAQKLCCYITKK